MKKYHPFSEKIVDILVRKVNNDNRHFFRILTGYYLSKVASISRQPFGLSSLPIQQKSQLKLQRFVIIKLAICGVYRLIDIFALRGRLRYFI